jgi:excisionase family DNA binding protein
MKRSTADKTKHSYKAGSMTPLLNIQEAAELLGIKAWTLRQWLSQRRIAYVKVGRLTRLRREDITAFIEANRREVCSFDRELVA